MGVLAASDEHLDADTILERALALEPAINRSTVYRTLERLCELGVVQHIHLGHGRTVYHLADSAAPHLHAQCQRCGAVIDVPGDLLDGAAARLARDRGFILDPGHAALSGICSDCCNNVAISDF